MYFLFCFVLFLVNLSFSLPLKSDVYLAHHTVCFDCILALMLPFLECGGGGRQLTLPIAVLYSSPIFWAAYGSLGESPESLLKWKTSDDGRIVHILGFHLDEPALTLFEMQSE